jgi:class 3 adenylate cyclase
MENPENEITRKLSAIMFIDIAGYSKMMGQDADRTLDLLNEYKNIVTYTVKEYKGSVIKWLGDGTFCEFSSAVYAVDCALRIHEQLKWTNKDLPKNQRLYVRIGVNIGEVSLRDNDLYGDSVNVASRIEAVAPIGGIAVSGSVFVIIKTYPRYKIKKMRRVKLKNIDYNYDIYAVKTGFEKSKFKPKEIASLALGLIIVTIFYFNSGFLKPYVESNSGDSDMEYKAAEINIPSGMQEKKYISFYKSIREKKALGHIIELLDSLKEAETLSYSHNPDSLSARDKCLILLNEQNLNGIIFNRDKEYYDFQTKQQLKDFKNSVAGLKIIWVELF